MDFYKKSSEFAVSFTGSNIYNGLSIEGVRQNRAKFGENEISKRKKPSFIRKLLSALKEPMMLILLISFFIAIGANIADVVKTGKGNFAECFGILFAIILSVSITLIMEGSSEKAFVMLNKIYDDISIKVIRGGQILAISRKEVCVGDIVILESGDKIVADGRLIESNSLIVDESALTGESQTVNKDANYIFEKDTPLAERNNCLYSGTFIMGGNGKMVVTAVGDNTEIGKIAVEISEKNQLTSPLQQKLAKLGKLVTILGVISAVIVFVLSLVKLIITNSINFDSVQNLFISCIILIVAAVPEGLPTIVAVSLALNMIKLAKENALIKKMTATETAGAISVICSDKTGTLTMNKMTVASICTGEFCYTHEKFFHEELLQNFICNSTAEISIKKNEVVYYGSGTECALLSIATKKAKIDYKKYRKQFNIIAQIPFSSENKFMSTTIEISGLNRELIKGAPEKILNLCNLTEQQKDKILSNMISHQKKARRIICFAHNDGEGYVYDGFASLVDEIRKDVYDAIKKCKSAGIKIKILTGDNIVTAYAVAKELGIATSERQAINAFELEKLSDEELKKILPKISVIARSTPLIKLRIVKILKETGEVVAVTGDGINDAPAIRHADVGFAMGKSGSEITKEAADAVLLDDSFSTFVKTVSFGRNVYRNLQRFILFQISVNLSALIFITLCAILGINSPFNTFQLLWINVIMDGPPALTLGLEACDDSLMNLKPVQRSRSIVSSKMCLRILFNGIFISSILILQYLLNFLNVSISEKKGTIFTLFILLQLFNAFNSRELGSDSIFKRISKNKLMLLTFAFTFIMQICIVQFAYNLFGISKLSFITWLKVFVCAFSIIAISEFYKLIYRFLIKRFRRINRN